MCEMPLSEIFGNSLKPILDLANPQHEGPWGALSPIPENNAITVNEQALRVDLNDKRNKFRLDLPIASNDQFYSFPPMDGSVYSAAGDARAYSWDIETGKQKMVFKGHVDYLHCITAHKSSHQIITGSEDGTTRIWDCRSGLCTQIIHPGKNFKSEQSSWVSCIDIDSSESWLACGTGTGLSVWSLLSYECIFSMGHFAPVQDLLFDNNQIVAVGSEPVLTRFSINGTTLSQLKCAPQSAFSVSLHHPSGVIAVGGYGALVDVLTQFGSHLCTFRCPGLDNYS